MSRKLPLNQACPGMVTARPILGFLGQVLLREDVTLTGRHIYYLNQMEIDAIYVRDERIRGPQPRDLISCELRGECRALISRVMRDMEGETAGRSVLAAREKEILLRVNELIDEILNREDSLLQLADIRSRDGYVFAHSVNCCVLSCLIGVRLGFERETLTVLAVGSLLHDLGLIAVPRMIISKPGSLTEGEYLSVQQHPAHGLELLKKTKLFSERAGAIILEHHERSMGQGYPRALKKDQCSVLSRIVAVADVYDALTSDKPYRAAYPAHRALEMLRSLGGEYFDGEILNLFLHHAIPYPVGTYVQLSNGESGFVVENRAGFNQRPVVRVLYRRDKSAHPAPFHLDLKKNLDMKVMAVLEEPPP